MNTKTSKKQKSLSRPDAYREFVVWMASSYHTREPKTQGKLAKLIGVSPDTLSNYKKRGDFWVAVDQKKLENMKTISIQKEALEAHTAYINSQ